MGTLRFGWPDPISYAPPVMPSFILLLSPIYISPIPISQLAKPLSTQGCTMTPVSPRWFPHIFEQIMWQFIFLDPTKLSLYSLRLVSWDMCRIFDSLNWPALYIQLSLSPTDEEATGWDELAAWSGVHVADDFQILALPLFHPDHNAEAKYRAMQRPTRILVDDNILHVRTMQALLPHVSPTATLEIIHYNMFALSEIKIPPVSNLKFHVVDSRSCVLVTPPLLHQCDRVAINIRWETSVPRTCRALAAAINLAVRTLDITFESPICEGAPLNDLCLTLLCNLLLGVGAHCSDSLNVVINLPLELSQGMMMTTTQRCAELFGIPPAQVTVTAPKALPLINH